MSAFFLVIGIGMCLLVLLSIFYQTYFHPLSLTIIPLVSGDQGAST